jgi:hypothetical protein
MLFLFWPQHPSNLRGHPGEISMAPPQVGEII